MKYKGMTVNERLYVSGLIDKFDSAVKRKNVNEIRLILKKVELTESSVNDILNSYGLD
jgi:molecular chaperone GrpE (heat shock protein)